MIIINNNTTQNEKEKLMKIQKLLEKNHYPFEKIMLDNGSEINGKEVKQVLVDNEYIGDYYVNSDRFYARITF